MKTCEAMQNAGHVKQGLKCKHCRVNIHHTCGAKVASLLFKYCSFFFQLTVCLPKKKKALLSRKKSSEAKTLEGKNVHPEKDR